MVVIGHAEAVVRPPAGRCGRGAQDPQAGRGAARPGGLDPAGAGHRVVLDGLRVPAIAAALGCGQKAVRYRLARFAADGLDGLGDRPGAGRRPRIGQDQRSQLIALVASPPPGRGVRDGAGELVAADATGPAVWTLNALTAAARAAGIDIARSQVRRILLAEGVRWRRPRSWAASADPEFGPKEPGSWTTTSIRRRTPRSSPPTSSAR